MLFFSISFNACMVIHVCYFLVFFTNNFGLKNTVFWGNENNLGIDLCYLPQSSASTDNTNLYLNNSSYSALLDLI